MAEYPRINDRDHDLLKKIAENTADTASGTSGGVANVKVTELDIGGSPVSDTNPVPVEGAGYSSSASFTRPNTTPTLSALDVVGTSPAANLTFSDIGPAAGGKVVIVYAALRIDVAAVAAGMTQFRLHLYSSAPTAIADDAAYNLPSADRDKYLGYIELPTPVDLGDTIFAGTEEGYYPVRKEITVPSGGAIYGILQTVGSYAATAQAVYNLKIKSVGV